MSSLSASAVIRYLENKGYAKTAKLYRSSSNFGNDSANPINTLTEMHNFYYDLNDVEEDVSENQDGNESDGSNTLDMLSRKRKYPEPAAPTKVIDSSECERCFLGNMSFKISEESLQKAFEDCGTITNYEWVTDKQTGQFYGSGFVVFDTVDAARKAVAATGRAVLGRPIKVNFAPLKKPEGGDKKKMPPAPRVSEKPADCRTLFLGNLAFEVTEEAIREMFQDCGEIYQVRFQIRENGDFKGCGFIEFIDTYSIDQAIKKHTHNLCGRPVRIDYA